KDILVLGQKVGICRSIIIRTNNGSQLRLGREALGEPRKRVVVNAYIGVDKYYISTLNQTCPEISCPRRTTRTLDPNVTKAMRCNDLLDIVGRAIVHHQNVKIIILRQDKSSQTLLQILGRVIYRQDY